MAVRRVLVIEDEPGAREALASLLAEEGYETITASLGSVGMQRFLESRPDVVVCDYRLPDTDGLQLIRAMRSRREGPVLFVVLSAACGGDAAERTVRSEADAFLAKPVDLAALHAVLQSHLEPREEPIPLLDAPS